MSNAVEYLEKAIQDLESEQAKIALAIGQLRNTLASMKNGGPPKQKTAPGVFQRKYEVNAKELILRVLRENRKALHVGQIREALAAHGYEFRSQTVALTLKHLGEQVRRVKAPTGSGFSYAYTLAPSGGVEEPKAATAGRSRNTIDVEALNRI